MLHPPRRSRAWRWASCAGISLMIVGCSAVGRSTGSPTTAAAASSSAIPSSGSVATIDGMVGSSGNAAWKVTAAGLAVSSDGGIRWSSVAMPTGVATTDIAAVAHVTAGPIWIAAKDGRAVDVLTAEQPGAPWTAALLTPTWPAVSGLNAPADRVVSTPGNNGLVTVAASIQVGMMSGFADLFVSTDGGVTFKEHQPTGGTQAEDVWWSDAFVDQDTGVVVTGPTRASILHTTDGGADWTASTVVGLPAVGRYAIGDPTIVGSDVRLPVTSLAADGSETFTIFSSADGGATFQASGPGVDLGSTYDPPATAGTSGSDIWVLEPGSGILHESADSGGSWTRVASNGLSPNVVALDVTGPSTATALVANTQCQSFKSGCVTSQYLRITTDGGLTWSSPD